MQQVPKRSDMEKQFDNYTSLSLEAYGVKLTIHLKNPDSKSTMHYWDNFRRPLPGAMKH